MNSLRDRSTFLDKVADLPTQRLPSGHLCALSSHLATVETTALPRIGAPSSHGPGRRVVAWLLVGGGALGAALATLGVVGRVAGVAGGVAGPLVPLLGLAGASVLVTAGAVVLAGVELPRRAWLGLQALVVAAVVAAHGLLVTNLVVGGALCWTCLGGSFVGVPVFWYVTARVHAQGWLPVHHAVRGAMSVAVDRRRLAVACWWGGLVLLPFLTGPWSAQRPVEAGTLAAVALISTATVVGAWLATRWADRMGLWLSLASALMMATALADIVPHVWHETEELGTSPWVPALALGAAFTVVTVLTRGGCGHGHDDGATAATFGGIGAAAALTAHRVIEGATIALTPSPAVIGALFVHSASEGLALAALFGQARRNMLPWLAIAVAGPAVGVVVTVVSPLPEAVVPVLLAMVAGVLLRTALVGVSLAAAKRRSGELRTWHVVAAAVAATGLAVVSLAGAGH